MFNLKTIKTTKMCANDVLGRHFSTQISCWQAQSQYVEDYLVRALNIPENLFRLFSFLELTIQKYVKFRVTKLINLENV